MALAASEWGGGLSPPYRRTVCVRGTWWRSVLWCGWCLQHTGWSRD